MIIIIIITITITIIITMIIIITITITINITITTIITMYRTQKAPTPRGAKKRVVETEPEPAYTEVADSQRTVELLISATADFAKYKCGVEAIRFKDTLMFQTRVYE